MANPIKSIPVAGSSGAEWKLWHQVMKNRFGKKSANVLWLKFWRKTGTEAANTNDLREYLEDQGIKIDAGVFSKIYDTGADVADFYGGIMNMGKYTAYALIGITVIGVGMIIFNIARQPIAAAKAGAAFMPAGRAAKALK